MPETEQLTGRVKQVHDGIQAGKEPKDIAAELGITRNAVYQHIGRLKRDGVLEDADPRFSRPPARRRRPSASNGDGAPSPATVMDATEQYLATVRARLDAIDKEEESHRDALTVLAGEREQIALVLERMEGLTTQ